MNQAKPRTLREAVPSMAWLIVLGLLACGCGTGQYERTMLQRAAELKHESAFRLLMPSQQVPGSELWIRLPKNFHDKPLRQGNRVAGATVGPERITPQIVDIPGLLATYEAMIPEADGPEETVRKLACYCHVFQVRYREGIHHDPAENIRRQFQLKGTHIPPQWVDVGCATPEGRRIDWKMLQVELPQPFYTVKGKGPGKIEELPGLFVIFERREGDEVLGMVWRVPKAIASRLQWPKPAELAGGCLVLKPGSAPEPGQVPADQLAGEPGEEPGTEPGEQPASPGQPPSGETSSETPAEPGSGETASAPSQPETPEQPGTTPGGQPSGEPGGEQPEPAFELRLPADDPALVQESINHLEQIGRALLEYHRRFGQFPPAARYVDREGKPLLSWRVALLPFLGKDDFHREFHLGEPWDSPHNRKLARRIPKVFQTPGGPPGELTCYLAAVGSGTAFSPLQGVPQAMISDGPGNTLVVVEADPERAVVWTRPEEWQYIPAQPNDGLGRLRGDFFLGLAADGSVHRVPLATPADVLRAAFSARGGEPFKMGNFASLPGSTVEQPGSSTEPGGQQPAEQPGQATQLLAQAREALQQGREQEGLTLVMAEGVAGAAPEVLAALRWFPAGKEPRLALRFAVALEVPELSAGQPHQPAGVGGASEQLAQFWQQKLIQPLVEQLEARVGQGRFGRWLAESAASATSNQQGMERRPGIVIFTASSLEEIRRRCEQEGVDVALVGQIRVRSFSSCWWTLGPGSGCGFRRSLAVGASKWPSKGRFRPNRSRR